MPDFSLTALTTGDVIGIAAIVATLFGTLLGVLIAQWLSSRSDHRTQSTSTEVTNQRILARIVRTLEGEKDEDGFQKTKGFMQTTDDRLSDLEEWRRQSVGAGGT